MDEKETRDLTYRGPTFSLIQSVIQHKAGAKTRQEKKEKREKRKEKREKRKDRVPRLFTTLLNMNHLTNQFFAAAQSHPGHGSKIERLLQSELPEIRAELGNISQIQDVCLIADAGEFITHTLESLAFCHQCGIWPTRIGLCQR